MSTKLQFITIPVQGIIRRCFHRFGYEIVKMGADYTASEREIMAKVKPFTATSPERVSGLISAVKYLVRNRVEGDFVECGVWRGGSMMAAMLTLVQLGDTSRNFYLYDTYEGMTPPTDKDKTFNDDRAADLLAMTAEDKEGASYWCVAGLKDVQQNVFSTGYPREKIHFIQGRVEDTLPASMPKKIALLRLDTDWYESTYHELIHLYPLLCTNGVLIIDDYGFWQGCRQAVDDYFARQTAVPLLNKLDFSGRSAVKPA
jgi:O-methyltransferase